MSFQRVLIAVDDGPLAARAADVGLDLASKLGAQLAFVHVAYLIPALAYAGALVPEERLPGAPVQDGRKLLATFTARAQRDHAPTEFVPVGRPADEILRTAKDWGADLIVLGSHGRSGVKRALLGSVAEEVLRGAHCAVLVVRPAEG
jgi:nucleotide-binding universal stress UspA family protein